MEYPILEEGREIGRLHARQEGLYTVFEARLPPRSGVTRLYLCGGGGSRLLGVMEPGSGGCLLCRRLSRRELPAGIRYASTDPAEKETDEGWIGRADGICVHPQKRLLAIPAALRHNRGQVRIQGINGKEYIVFRW